MQIVVGELRANKEKCGDERRNGDHRRQNRHQHRRPIAEEDMAITVSNTGYIKRTAITEYRNQKRGGKGRIGMLPKKGLQSPSASTHAYIMIFSDKAGRTACSRDPGRRTGWQASPSRTWCRWKAANASPR